MYIYRHTCIAQVHPTLRSIAWGAGNVEVLVIRRNQDVVKPRNPAAAAETRTESSHPQKPGRREPRNPAASDPHPKLCQRLCKDNGIVYQWLSVYPKFGAIHCYTILDVWGQYIFAIHIARTCAILDIQWPWWWGARWYTTGSWANVQTNPGFKKTTA